MKAVTFVLVWFCVVQLNAQHKYDNNWMFGYRCGVSFSGNLVEIIEQAALISSEGCASISSAQGELQFYTNGNAVWNKQHQVMDGGSNLAIGQYLPEYGTSSTQGVLILPSLTDTNDYLIFTQNNYPDTGICVSTVDMSFNSGLGKVVIKNEPVYQGHYFSEKLAACRHANGRDWWLVSFEAAPDCNRYSVLLYTPEGTALHHVDTVGQVVSPAGQMVFSKQGNHSASVSGKGKVQVLDFDRCTGDLTENHFWGSNAGTYYHNNSFYGACFSPDESKLYVTPADGQVLLQFTKSGFGFFDSAPDTVWYNPDIDTTAGMCQLRLGQMQLAPDGKIYCSFSPNCIGTEWTEYEHHLSVINKPDQTAENCDFQAASVFVGNAPRYLMGGLPNMPNYNLGALVGSPCDTLTFFASSPSVDIAWSVYPNPASRELQLNIRGVASNALVEILNPLGRVVYRKMLSPQYRSVHHIVDVSVWPSGVYAVVLQCAGTRSVRKVTVNR